VSDDTVELNCKTTTSEKKVRTEDKQASQSIPDPPPYTPNPAESAALQKHRSRSHAQTSPRLKVVDAGGQRRLKYDHPDPAVASALFEEALGTADHAFVSGLVTQLSRLAYSTDPAAAEETLNFLFSVVRGAKPRDEMEAIIASEIAAIHVQLMKGADRLEQATSLRQQEMAEKMLNRLVRASASLLVTLKRYRGGPSK
jgi:hypothetical protein